MITLALMPLAALLAITVLCLRAKHMYGRRRHAIAEQVEQQRQLKSSQDAENDKLLVKRVISGTSTLGEQLAKYADSRQAILPDGCPSNPAHWTNDDLLNWVKRHTFSLLMQASRNILFRTALGVLVVVASALSLAAWKYSTLSNAPVAEGHEVFESPETDPLAPSNSKP